MKLLSILLVLMLSGVSWGQFVGPGAVAVSSATRGASRTAAPFPGQTQSDDFNRADNTDLGANWTIVEGQMQIISNSATALSAPDACERWSAITWTDNQSSECKVTADSVAGAGTGYGPTVRCSNSAVTYFRFVINGDGEWEVGAIIASAFTSIATGTTTYSAGAVAKITATGPSASTTVTVVYNGTQLSNTTANYGIGSGSPGIAYSASVNGSVDDWIGQDGL